ncbi:MAG: glutathione S-transferase N-terminal domain-containing protein [Anaerolineae bacterium]
MAKPILYIFAISHFCEKARWALDYLQIDHQLVYLPPGPHAIWAKRSGLASSTLPILKIKDRLIQGSDQIIDWAESVTGSEQSLTPEAYRDECLQLEKRLDKISGVHTRRMFYSEALVEHSADVRKIFTHNLSAPKRLFVSAIWPLIRQSMIKSMDLGRAQAGESKVVLAGELAWLDDMLADGRRFLVGDSLSRADITASGLYARLASIGAHPAVTPLRLPPRTEAIAQEWKMRPFLGWVRKNYSEFR